MLPTLRILYAEDDPRDAELTRTHLAEHAPDLALEVVPTGGACLDRIATAGCDVLLLDHRLPDMEGLDVLRTLVRAGTRLPVVMVTGVGDEELVVAALRLGASSYVPKQGPYLEALPGLLRSAVADHHARRRHGLLALTPRRILYVEHYPMDVELTERHLAEMAPHLELEVARSCTEALARLARPPAFDAALIDLRMPDRCGLELVQEARRRHLPLPPFIMISGKGDEAAAIASLALGAADYVPKREGYLDQLLHTLDRAIAHDRLDRLNARLESVLAQNDRLASLGMLTAGIAHEINNPLAYILHHLETLVEELPRCQALVERARVTTGPPREDCAPGPDVLADAEARCREALTGAQRIREIVRGLGSFTRVEKDAVEPVELVGPIEYALAVAWNELKYRAHVVKEIGVTPPVLGSEGRIAQVFLNLLINAAHAIPEGDVDHHRITVRTRLEGDTVVAEVADTGAGIPASHLEHIFEPFFSTKPVGGGSGLGLSIVQGIVTGYGGTITVASEPGQGTRFEIRLPAASRTARTPRSGEAGDPPLEVVRGRILVVDDDPGMRSMLRRVLRDHEVVTVESGVEACETLARDSRFDLVLCDVMMPRMPGTEVHRWLLEHDPDLARRVVLMTGGAFTPGAREYIDRASCPVVSKPFVSRELRSQVAGWLRSLGAGR